MSHHNILSKHKGEIIYKNQDIEMGRLSSGWISEVASRVAAKVLFLDLDNGLKSVLYFLFFVCAAFF